MQILKHLSLTNQIIAADLSGNPFFVAGKAKAKKIDFVEPLR